MFLLATHIALAQKPPGANATAAAQQAAPPGKLPLPKPPGAAKAALPPPGAAKAALPPPAAANSPPPSEPPAATAGSVGADLPARPARQGASAQLKDPELVVLLVPPEMESPPPAAPQAAPPAALPKASLAPAAAVPAAGAAEPNYLSALSLAVKYLDVQQSGTLPSWNRVRRAVGGWRDNAHTWEGAAVKKDLSGGYYNGAHSFRAALPTAFLVNNLAVALGFFGQVGRLGRLGSWLSARCELLACT
jgi:hypothetical protein